MSASTAAVRAGRGVGRWEVAGLSLLIAAAALNGMSFSLAGRSVYPEYVALAVVGAGVAIATRAGRLTWRWPSALVPLSVWLAAGFVASVINAPRPGDSEVLWLKLAMMVATFAITANLARGRPVDAARAMLVAAGLVGAGALVAVVGHGVAGTTLGMQPAPGGAYVPDGTLLEANLLGSYLAAAAALALALLCGGPAVRRRLGALAAAAGALAVAGLILSVTRAAWLALLAVLGVAGAAYLWRRGGEALRRGLVIAAAVSVGAIGAFASDLPSWRFDWRPHDARGASLAYRLASLAHPSREGNLWVRVEVCREALARVPEHPVVGWGVGAFGQLARYPNQDAPAWIPNLFVHTLFDTGAVGLLGLLVGLGLVAARAVRAWQSSAGIPRAVAGGLALALLALLVAFQTTEGSWLAYPWITLGLAEAVGHEAAGGAAPAPGPQGLRRPGSAR